MMTKRDLSWAKCRSISGRVPLPIEPKPIMTMGPEIFAWIAEAGLMSGSPENRCWSGKAKRGRTDQAGSGAAPLRGHFDLDLHLGLVEAGYHEQRCRRADIA